MSDILSERYLLYLRDMSGKVVSRSSGHSSQVLIRGTRGKKEKKFQRITQINLMKLFENPKEGYRRQQDQVLIF